MSSDDVLALVVTVGISLVPLSLGILWFIFFNRIVARFNRQAEIQSPNNSTLDRIVLLILRIIGLVVGIIIFLVILLVGIGLTAFNIPLGGAYD
jgi:hypothetical protein